MIAEFFSWLASLIVNAFASVLDLIFNLFGGLDLPIIDNFSNFLVNLWDKIFEIFGYFRSALLLDTFEMNIIITILTIRILYKPIVSVIKMFVGWFSKLKL